MVGAANDLNITQSGFPAFNSTTGVFAGRTLTAGTGISISNGNGIAGNPVIAVNGGVVGETITGNSGGALSPTAGNWNIVTANASVRFVGATSTLTQDFKLSNLILGSSGTSITSATQSVGLGFSVLNALTSGSQNTMIGFGAGILETTGSANTIVGAAAFVTANGANNNSSVGTNNFNKLTTGSSNSAFGDSVLGNLLTGSNNQCFGQGSGANYTSSESSNILINHLGVTAESNTLRIGTGGSGSGQQNRTFIAAISGITVAASAPVGVDTNGQLSSLGFGTSGQVLTSTGAASSPTWQAVVTSNTGNSAIAKGSAVVLSTGTNSNVTSISLAAGTWVVSGIVEFTGTPTVSGPQQISISTTSATHGTLGDNSAQVVWLSTNFTVGDLPVTVPSYQLTLGSTTTVYLVASGVFSVGAMSAYGRISAFRIA